MPSVIEPKVFDLPSDAASHGCFETMRSYAGRIFRLNDHIDRLYASAAYLGLRPPADRSGVARRLREALKRSGISEAVVRIALIPSAGGQTKPSIIVQKVKLPTALAYRIGIKLSVVPAQKFPVGAIDPQAKYSARLGSVLALVDTYIRGADEALFMDMRGYITESTASNFAIVRRGEIFTSPCWTGLLWGITRDVIFELAHSLGIPMRDVPLTRHDCYVADEAFLSSTVKEILPVTEIDGRRIGTGRPGPITKRMQRAFRRLVRKELQIKICKVR